MSVGGRPLVGPLTPGGVLVARPAALAATLAGSLVLTVLVVADRLDVVDAPVGGGVRSLGRGWLQDGFRAATELGGGPVVIPLAALCACLVWRRSPPLAAAIVLAVGARYGFEVLLKEAVGRERPMEERLTEASGPSFPSGHVFGATVGWGVLPATVRALTDRLHPWRVAMAAWATAVAVVAASRVYLGVHWFTDTIGSVLFGLLVLALVDVAVLDRRP